MSNIGFSSDTCGDMKAVVELRSYVSQHELLHDWFEKILTLNELSDFVFLFVARIVCSSARTFSELGWEISDLERTFGSCVSIRSLDCRSWAVRLRCLAVPRSFKQ